MCLCVAAADGTINNYAATITPDWCEFRELQSHGESIAIHKDLRADIRVSPAKDRALQTGREMVIY